jgi:hypothetical protein
MLQEKGVIGLIEYAKTKGVDIDLSKHSSACGVCREIIKKIPDEGDKMTV